MFLISNFNLGNIPDLFSFADEFFNAVGVAFQSVINALRTFINLFVSLFNRLNSSNTAIYSFLVITFGIFIVFAVVKIWRD